MVKIGRKKVGKKKIAKMVKDKVVGKVTNAPTVKDSEKAMTMMEHPAMMSKKKAMMGR